MSYGDVSTQDNLDPAVLTTSFGMLAGGLLYDNLCAVDEQNQPIPALATHWSSTPDAKTWTFELRRGVEFHSGQPFTSADAAFTVSRVLATSLGSGAQPIFAPYLTPSQIRVRGPYAIEFDCLRPCAFLPVLLSTYFMPIVPNGTTAHDAATKGIGTGPFKLVSFEPAVELNVVRNPAYWQSGRPYLDGIKVSAILEPSTKLQSVTSGNADVCDGILYSQLPSVASNSSVNLIKAAGANFTPAVCYQDATPFRDVRVRRAFKYAMNPAAIVSGAYFGAGTESANVSIPPNDPYYPDSVKPFPYDPDQARSLLKQAGYGDGLDIAFYYSDGAPGMEDTALIYQQQAKAAGINASLKKLPYAVYYNDIVGKPLSMNNWLRQHVAFSLPLMYGGSKQAYWDESGFGDPRVTAAIAKLESSLDVTAQKQAVADAYTIINQDSGDLIPCYGDRIWAAKPTMKGIRLDWQKVASFTGAYLA